MAILPIRTLLALEAYLVMSQSIGHGLERTKCLRECLDRTKCPLVTGINSIWSWCAVLLVYFYDVANFSTCLFSFFHSEFYVFPFYTFCLFLTFTISPPSISRPSFFPFFSSHITFFSLSYSIFIVIPSLLIFTQLSLISRLLMHFFNSILRCSIYVFLISYFTLPLSYSIFSSSSPVLFTF